VKNLFSLFLIFLRELPRAIFPAPGKEVSALTEIKLKKGEPVDRALRRLKKKVDREGTLKVVRGRRQFEKPSERRRRKEKVARFSAMLAARHADD
jgi:small subunit ribosomal protein S21